MRTCLIDPPRKIDKSRFDDAIKIETELNYFVNDGKYWKHENEFETEEVDKLDKIWLDCLMKQT